MPLPAAGARVRSSDFAAIFPNGVDAWEPYTPALVQATGTVTATVTYAAYFKIGRSVTFAVNLTVTGAGTAGGHVTVSLPVAATASWVGMNFGAGIVYDVSANTVYPGTPQAITTTTVAMYPTTTAGSPSFLGAREFAAALASGDIVRVSGTYESAA